MTSAAHSLSGFMAGLFDCLIHPSLHSPYPSLEWRKAEMTNGNRDKKTEFEHQPKGVIVSISPSLTARDMTRQFIAEDARQCGGSQPAQRALARRLGVSPYTLRNLAGGGLKRVCVDLYARLKAEQIRRLSASIARSEHELHVARSMGLDPRCPEFQALEAAAKAARKVMEGA